MSDDVRDDRPKTSNRDYDRLHDDLERWLGTTAVPGSDPKLSELNVPEKNGMSSETVLFDVTTPGEGTRSCVARIEPETAAIPVFPEYDLPKQFNVMRLIEAETDVPVPPTLWLEPAGDAIGSPFFVMERVDGDVPPDVLPYPWGAEGLSSWVRDATPEQLQKMVETSVSVLARLHTVNATDHDLAFLDHPERPEPTALGRHIGHERDYYEWTVNDEYPPVPVIERGLDWLEANLPEDEGETVLSWGDSRIGNMLFRDFEPVGVLDWEMVGVGPREIDLGWMIFLHRFFEDLGVGHGFATMPHFMCIDDVAAAYERLSGHAPQDLDYFFVYAAVRDAIVMSRVKQRSILFGEDTKPDDPDDMVMHRGPLEELLDGTYWDTRPRTAEAAAAQAAQADA